MAEKKVTDKETKETPKTKETTTPKAKETPPPSKKSTMNQPRTDEEARNNPLSGLDDHQCHAIKMHDTMARMLLGKASADEQAAVREFWAAQVLSTSGAYAKTYKRKDGKSGEPFHRYLGSYAGLPITSKEVCRCVNPELQNVKGAMHAMASYINLALNANPSRILYNGLDDRKKYAL